MRIAAYYLSFNFRVIIVNFQENVEIFKQFGTIIVC